MIALPLGMKEERKGKEKRGERERCRWVGKEGNKKKNTKKMRWLQIF